MYKLASLYIPFVLSNNIDEQLDKNLKINCHDALGSCLGVIILYLGLNLPRIMGRKKLCLA